MMMILFLKEVVHITPEIRIKLKHCREQIYSNTSFSMVWPILLSFQIIFNTVLFKGWDSWIQLLLYFLIAHLLKTLNKEQYDLTHVVLAVILQIFIKSTLVWHMLHFPIFLEDNTIWSIFSSRALFLLEIFLINSYQRQHKLIIFRIR